MRAIVFLSTVLLPVIIAPGILFFDDVTPKLVVVLFAAAACLVTWVREDRASVPVSSTIRGRLLLAACALCVAATLISTALARNRELAWQGSTWRGFGAVSQIAILVIAVVVAARSRNDESVRTAFVRGLCISGLLVSVYGMLQYAGFDPLLAAGGYHAGEGPFRIVRPPSTLGHVDSFAAFLLWPVFAGIFLAREETAPWWRRVGFAASGCAAGAIVLSGSRGAILGLLAGITCFTVIGRIRPKSVLIHSVVAIGLVTTFTLSPAGAQLRARLHWMSDDMAGGARLLLWRDAVSMASRSPLTGFGPENFIAEFPRYQSAALSRTYPDFYHESPHNLLLDTLVADGVPGLIGLVFLLGLAAFGGFAAARAGNRSSTALLAGLSAAVIAHMFAVLTLPTAFCLYVAAAILAAGRQTGTAENLRRSERIRLVPARAAIATCGGAFLLLVACQTAARDYTLAKVRRELESGLAVDAAKHYQGLRHHTATADLYFSRRFAFAAAGARDNLTKLQLAQSAYVAAQWATVNSEQRANAWYNLATLSAAAEDPPTTETALRKAVASAPNWFKPHWALARLLALAGRTQEAQSEGRIASALNGGKHAEVAATLASVAPAAVSAQPGVSILTKVKDGGAK